MSCCLFLSLSSPFLRSEKSPSRIQGLRLTAWAYCSLSITGCQLYSLDRTFVISITGLWRDENWEFQVGENSTLYVELLRVALCLCPSDTTSLIRIVPLFITVHSLYQIHPIYTKFNMPDTFSLLFIDIRPRVKGNFRTVAKLLFYV